MSKVKVGQVFSSLEYGDFEVINKIKSDLYTIKFVNTGYTTDAYFSAITKGQVKDNLVAKVCGIGCLGYATKKDNLKYYILWKGMLDRCYNPKNKYYRNYGGNNVKVCERWHRFDKFLEDISKIEGFDENKMLSGELQLDKDIKQFNSDNKIYSLKTCCFVKELDNLQYRKFSIQKEFIAISPTGKVYNDKSIQGFCRKFNLTPTHVCNCLNEKESSHKGWKFKYTNNKNQ